MFKSKDVHILDSRDATSVCVGENSCPTNQVLKHTPHPFLLYQLCNSIMSTELTILNHAANKNQDNL